MSREVKPLLERQTQLSMIAYLTILALVSVCAGLVYMLITSTPLPTGWILGDTWVRAMGFAFILSIVVYLADQQRRLQARLNSSYEQLAEAREEIEQAYERLAFAYHAAETMTANPTEDGLCELLDDVAGHFGGDAAAVVGTDMNLFVRDERFRDEAVSAVSEAAIETIRVGKPLATAKHTDGSTAIAIPLRVGGHLTSVLCVWRHDGGLTEQHIGGLQLVARILEMSMENHSLLERTGGQLGGMVRAMLDLLDRRRPAYTTHAELVSRLADSLAQRLNVCDDERHSLRVAALLHDVGMLELPDSVVRLSHGISPKQRATLEHHPGFGADLARVSGLDADVQSAIAGHHERFDGSGYPLGLLGDDIPRLARILAVADDFADMTSPQAGQPPLQEDQALHVMRLGAGTQYDPHVIAVLIQLAEQTLGEISVPASFNPEALLSAG